MSLAQNLARAGNTKDGELDAAAKEKGKIAARIHDEVRVARCPPAEILLGTKPRGDGLGLDVGTRLLLPSGHFLEAC